MADTITSTTKPKPPAPPAPPAIQSLTPPRIAIVDHPGSGRPGLAELVKIAAALSRQVAEHFDPYWNARATVVAVTTPLASDWVMGLFKDADQPGALGYHDETAGGLPLGKVFPLLDAQDGASLSVTLSHEVLEMLADPYLCTAAQSPTDGKFWAMEVADAVEQDEYLIDGVRVSNFVTPHYFEPPSNLLGAGKLDMMGLIKTPYEVRPGGYMQWFDPTQGWQQIVHSEVAPRAYRLASMRGKRRHSRVRSVK